MLFLCVISGKFSNLKYLKLVFPNFVYYRNIEGLWGVWETCGNQTQFELRKGGVFRAVPIEADGCSIK